MGAPYTRHAGGSLPAVLRLPRSAYLTIVGHAYDGLPLEACGLLGGDAATGRVDRYYPTANVAASSKLYTVDPRGHLHAERDAEDRGGELIGVVHSHTHTDAYPSPTDVAQAPDPAWHYVIVSLRQDAPVLRSFRIVDGNIEEEAVVLEDR
jgi:proteasome lid subunit RPN8/RPN11